MSYYRDQLENYLKTLDIKSEWCLDIGGGALPVKDRVKSWDVKNYRILDAKKEEQKVQPNYQCDLNNDDYNIEKIGTYDTIFCLEVFEYIWNPVWALDAICNCLIKKEGTLYITFPFIYPFHEPRKYDCLRYTKQFIETVLPKFKMQMKEIIDRKHKCPEKLIDMYKSDGMHIAGEEDVTGYIVKAVKK